jgi:hypothetical protein
MIRFFTSAALVFAVGCAITPVPFAGPDGGPAISMKCNGWLRTPQDCMVVVGRECPYGWNLIDSTSAGGWGGFGIPAISNWFGSAGGYWHIAAECKGTPAELNEIRLHLESVHTRRHVPTATQRRMKKRKQKEDNCDLVHQGGYSDGRAGRPAQSSSANECDAEYQRGYDEGSKSK